VQRIRALLFSFLIIAVWIFPPGRNCFTRLREFIETIGDFEPKIQGIPDYDEYQFVVKGWRRKNAQVGRGTHCNR